MEKVLCVKRNNLPKEWVKKRSVMKIKESDFYKTCSTLSFEFKSRKNIEQDLNFKQIIPYIIIQTKDLKYIAVYKRKGSEERLHDLWSIGIGGHINPVDSNGNENSLKKTIIAGMERELDEELLKMPKADKPIFTGIINEEETDVGSVHIGAVFKILTENKNSYTGGDELFDFQWKKTDDAKHLNLELWSKLAFELIH
jgi:predicted NUDIX family phosphoesterase